MPDAKPHPPVMTVFFCLACVAVHVALTPWTEHETNLSLLQQLAPLGAAVRQGEVWGLFTSAFVHLKIWHIFFNLYWLWLLGRIMEGVTGSVRFAVFYLLAAAVSSSAQLAFSEATGIGASGVVYAIFGYLWHVRRTYPAIGRIITPQLSRFLFGWLGICFILDWTGILRIANAAHVGGVVFGIIAADAFVVRRARALSFAATVLLLVLSGVNALWTPTWTAQYAMDKGVAAIEAEDYRGAADWFRKSLERGGDRGRGLYNLTVALLVAGELDEAQKSLRDLEAVSPQNAKLLQQELKHLNDRKERAENQPGQE